MRLNKSTCLKYFSQIFVTQSAGFYRSPGLMALLVLDLPPLPVWPTVLQHCCTNSYFSILWCRVSSRARQSLQIPHFQYNFRRWWGGGDGGGEALKLTNNPALLLTPAILLSTFSFSHFPSQFSYLSTLSIFQLVNLPTCLLPLLICLFAYLAICKLECFLCLATRWHHLHHMQIQNSD